MIRGQLGVDERPATLFVFEGLIAELKRPRYEKLALVSRQWNAAIDGAWQFDLKVCDRMRGMIDHSNQILEVITWHNQEFADVLFDRLWNMHIRVRAVSATTYEEISPQVATDRDVSTVYDPEHRFGYGFKARDFWADFG